MKQISFSISENPISISDSNMLKFLNYISRNFIFTFSLINMQKHSAVHLLPLKHKQNLTTLKYFNFITKSTQQAEIEYFMEYSNNLKHFTLKTFQHF